jgi:hypothetical protein
VQYAIDLLRNNGNYVPRVQLLRDPNECVLSLSFASMYIGHSPCCWYAIFDFDLRQSLESPTKARRAGPIVLKDNKGRLEGNISKYVQSNACATLKTAEAPRASGVNRSVAHVLAGNRDLG